MAPRARDVRSNHIALALVALVALALAASVLRLDASFVEARRLRTLVPASLFAGFIALVVVNAIGELEARGRADDRDEPVSKDCLDDADSTGGGASAAAVTYGVSDASARLEPRSGRITVEDTSGSTTKRVGYLILDVIARGANSVVYLASVRMSGVDGRSSPNSRLVALKEPHDRYRTKAEIACLGAIPPGEHMCAFLGPVIEPRSRSWMMMFELCQHGSLRHCLRERTYPRDGRAIFDAITMVLKGVAHVHAHGMVHRDVKMDNFLIQCSHCSEYRGGRLSDRCRRDHVMKISDLGLSKAENMSFDSSARLTGTLAYFAPERLVVVPSGMSPEKYRLCDLYAAGLLVWELLYYAKFGVSKRVVEDVFDLQQGASLSDGQIVLKISTGAMQPRLDFIEPRIRAWLEKCIAFDPNARYRSVDEAMKRLRTLGRDFRAMLPDEPDAAEEDSTVFGEN